MKPVLIVIAGPQVCGKTTASRIISQKFKNILFHPEINQYTILGGNHLGSAYVSWELEEKIIRADLARLARIVSDKRDLIHLAETGIFHTVYSQIFDVPQAQKFIKEYEKLYQEAKIGILFINTTPAVSWARRRGYYLKRTLSEIQKRNLEGNQAKKLREEMMGKYKARIFNLYSLWLSTFEIFSYPKIKIANNGKNLAVFEKKITRGFLKLARKMGIEKEIETTEI